MKQLILILLLIFSSACEQTEETPPQKPNILFAIADDASWKHFGAYGCNWVTTPAFDRVADEGILFLKAYTPNAKCAPSRACILTGRNSWQLEAAANHVPFFPTKFKTYAESLGEHGYWVGSVAKGWAPGVAKNLNGQPRQLTGPKFNKRQLTPPAQHISSNDYAANFADFLASRPAGQPFCFWYGSLEPHRAYEYAAGVTKGGKNPADVTEVPSFWPNVDTVRTDMLDYAYEIEHFDAHLQQMLDQLATIGELDNTVIVVTADNGMPFPRIKGDAYEYSHHLPLAIRWGNGIVKPGRTVNDYVNFIDFAPTFLELAGLSASEAGMQPTTGKSLTDIFFTEKTTYPDRDFVLVGKERHDVGRPNNAGYPIRGIVQEDLLYLHNYAPDRWPKGNPETGYLNTDGSPTKTYILDTRRKKGDPQFWQLNFGKRPTEELYDVQADPFCVNNLADTPEYADRKAALEKRMTALLTAQQDPRILDNGAVFENYPYAGENVKDFYTRHQVGENISAGWVNETDFEPLSEKKD
ncbi:MAG: sulfatase [Bacteroidota bacterium]